MYELKGFGARLQQLRKQKGMTQEDLACRIGVTGQAVSKWETGLSYPDITLVTTLATILEADIHHLFGKKEVSLPSNFPQTLDGMPMVHNAQGTACYSNKTVLSIAATGVKFADGSTAELSNKLVVNLGIGEIRFLGDGNERGGSWQHIDHSITSMVKEFGITQNIEITINTCCQCKIIQSQDGETRVEASGDAVFIDILDVEVSNKTLKISQKPHEGYKSRSHNKIAIEMPCEAGNHADITINGSSDIVSEIAKFNTGALRINGSGILKMQGFEHCTANINGSGDITLASVATLTVAINGSGVIDVNEITGGDFSTKISGVGSLNIKSGNCEKFGVDISGSGDIDAASLTAREANIVIHNDGNVTLGRVLERSSEQIKKNGIIRVLKRGIDCL